MKKILIFIIMISGLSSCLVGPKYKSPALPNYKAYGDSTATVGSAEKRFRHTDQMD